MPCSFKTACFSVILSQIKLRLENWKPMVSSNSKVHLNLFTNADEKQKISLLKKEWNKIYERGHKTEIIIFNGSLSHKYWIFCGLNPGSKFKYCLQYILQSVPKNMGIKCWLLYRLSSTRHCFVKTILVAYFIFIRKQQFLVYLMEDHILEKHKNFFRNRRRSWSFLLILLFFWDTIYIFRLSTHINIPETMLLNMRI